MKSILITGASSGIGYATAKLLLEKGYKVVALSRNMGALTQLLSIYSNQLIHMPIDLTDFDAYQNVFDNLGKIDGFVHSAGIVINNPIKYFSLEKYNAVINLNQTAPLLIVSTLVRKRLLNQSSSLVFISSINGPKVAIKGCAAYAASKCALQGISRVLALELSPMGIRVNTVSPGMVQTELVDGLNQLSSSALQVDMAKYPLGNRYAKPKEVAETIEFLLSSSSSFITGQDFVIDGGYCVN
jgi:NAD(P)-dependent dehydrogenase (short-subunit alcohol dehydrogenase family)